MSSNPIEKIRALIVDDEPLARRGIRQSLQPFADVEIIGECKNGREAVAAIEKQKPDLVFLDVQMPLLDGFGVIEETDAENLPPVVVFVTAFDEHAIRAFEINALDYLLKPVDPERFKKTLERVRENLKNKQSERLDEKLSALLRDVETLKIKAEPSREYLRRFVIKESGRVFFLDTKEIDWISAEGNYIALHAKNKTYLLRETMDGIERKLDSHEFVRLRRSIIARIECIKELQPLFKGEFVVVLKDGTKLTSSRRYRQNLDALLKS